MYAVVAVFRNVFKELSTKLRAPTIQAVNIMCYTKQFIVYIAVYN
jgi:hypothetical protein